MYMVPGNHELQDIVFKCSPLPSPSRVGRALCYSYQSGSIRHCQRSGCERLVAAYIRAIVKNINRSNLCQLMDYLEVEICSNDRVAVSLLHLQMSAFWAALNLSNHHLLNILLFTEGESEKNCPAITLFSRERMCIEMNFLAFCSFQLFANTGKNKLRIVLVRVKYKFI